MQVYTDSGLAYAFFFFFNNNETRPSEIFLFLCTREILKKFYTLYFVPVG